MEFFGSLFSHSWTEYVYVQVLDSYTFNPNTLKYGPEKLRIRIPFMQCQSPGFVQRRGNAQQRKLVFGPYLSKYLIKTSANEEFTRRRLFYLKILTINHVESCMGSRHYTSAAFYPKNTMSVYLFVKFLGSVYCREALKREGCLFK